MILGVRSKRDNFKHVGAALPSHFSEYLALYTVAKGVTKTGILKKLFENWIKIQQANQSEDELIAEVINRIKIQWKGESTSKFGADYDAFKSKIKKELLSHGIPAETVQNIISKI